VRATEGELCPHFLSTFAVWYQSMNVAWNTLREQVDQVLDQLQSTNQSPPSREMCELLIAGEDHRFWTHRGVDVWALLRALFQTVVRNSPQGGSTIAMQLVRTLTRRYDRRLSRKLMEIALAIRLTRYVGRDRIPTLYLWVAYYGWRMNNYKQACARLTLEQFSTDLIKAARLVARLKYPQPRNTSVHRCASIRRRAHHLMYLRERRMVEEGRHAWNRFEYQTRLES
jgi:membrane peptidoglycan carboxypeptidase